MQETLIRYQVLIQYLEVKAEGYPDRASFEHVYLDYKTAKKEAMRVLKSIQSANKQILRATIEPVLLQEDLLAN